MGRGVAGNFVAVPNRVLKFNRGFGELGSRAGGGRVQSWRGRVEAVSSHYLAVGRARRVLWSGDRVHLEFHGTGNAIDV